MAKLVISGSETIAMIELIAVRRDVERDVAAEEVAEEVRAGAARRGREQHHADGEQGRQVERLHQPEADQRQQDQLAAERDRHRLRGARHPRKSSRASATARVRT